LTAIDLNSHLADAIPLKNKSQATVLKASKKMFNNRNSPINQPGTRLEIDNGTEFNALERYLKGEGVFVRRNKPGRHKQQALVENLNKTIGRAIFTIQNVNELATNQPYVEWTDLLPDII